MTTGISAEIRHRVEELEKRLLSPYASLSCETKGPGTADGAVSGKNRFCARQG